MYFPGLREIIQETCTRCFEGVTEDDPDLYGRLDHLEEEVYKVAKKWLLENMPDLDALDELAQSAGKNERRMYEQIIKIHMENYYID